MLTMLQTVDGWAEVWLKVMGAFLWQSTLLVAWCLRRSSPVVRHWLWQIVAPDAELARLVVELAPSVGLRRPPVVACVGGDCPLFVCGFWRPRVVLPTPLMSSLGPAERRQVILHELAHVKRRDLLWGWTAEIARTVYFFSPSLVNKFCERVDSRSTNPLFRVPSRTLRVRDGTRKASGGGRQLLLATKTCSPARRAGWGPEWSKTMTNPYGPWASAKSKMGRS